MDPIKNCLQPFVPEVCPLLFSFLTPLSVAVSHVHISGHTEAIPVHDIPNHQLDRAGMARKLATCAEQQTRRSLHHRIHVHSGTVLELRTHRIWKSPFKEVDGSVLPVPRDRSRRISMPEQENGVLRIHADRQAAVEHFPVASYPAQRTACDVFRKMSCVDVWGTSCSGVSSRRAGHRDDHD